MLQLAAVNYYYKALHLGCCSSPRSASVNKSEITHNFFSVAVFLLCFCCCCQCFCFGSFFSILQRSNLEELFEKASVFEIFEIILNFQGFLSK